MKTIQLVEDEASIAEPLVYQLERQGYRVLWDDDGARALDRFASDTPDIVLLDLMLPGMSGEDVCRAIRKDSSVPIIMLTAKTSEVDRVVGLELGADDYVTKPFSTRELIARINAVMRRSRPPSPPTLAGVLTAGDIRLDRDAHETAVAGNPVSLTPKEFEVLELLMLRQGKLVTREDILDEVWGPEYVGDTRTLDVHVKRIREKCEADPRRPRHVTTVRGLGYKFVP